MKNLPPLPPPLPPPLALVAIIKASLLRACAAAVAILLTLSMPAAAQPGKGNGPPEWSGGPVEWAGGPPAWAGDDEDDDDEFETEDEDDEDEDDDSGEKGNNGLRQAVTDLQKRVASLEALLGAADLDGDGFTSAGGDCNDADPLINPDAEEVLGDGVDNDCDSSTTDDGSAPMPVDSDGDGYYADDPDPALADCNDSDALVNPGAEEVPDNLIDDNCDGEVDETD